MSNKYDLLWHIRPIRTLDGIDFNISDVVYNELNDKQAELVKAMMPKMIEIVKKAPNEYDSLLHNEEVGEGLLFNVLAHVVGERIHFKLYKEIS